MVLFTRACLAPLSSVCTNLSAVELKSYNHFGTYNMAQSLTQLGRMLSRPDPMMTYLWEVQNLPFATDFLGTDPASYVEAFDVPFSNVKTTGVLFGGGYNYFPEFHDTSAFSMTFYGDSQGRVLKWLWHWKQLVKDFNSGLYNVPSEFKGDIVVNCLNTTGKPFLSITYHGCWPADTGNLPLDQEAAKVSIQQTFSLDSMELTWK